MKSNIVFVSLFLLFFGGCTYNFLNPSLETRVEKLVRKENPQYYSVKVFSILETDDKTSYKVSFSGISPYNDIKVRDTEIFSKSELGE